jgi:hypothetical protein
MNEDEDEGSDEEWSDIVDSDDEAIDETETNEVILTLFLKCVLYSNFRYTCRSRHKILRKCGI